MKAIKRILKGFLIFLALIVILIAGTLTWTIKNPNQAWKMIESRLLPKDMTITWKDFQFRAFPQEGWNWSPTLSILDLCIKKKDPWMSFCFNHVEVESWVSLKGLTNPQVEIYRFFVFSDYENFFRPSRKEKQTNNQELSIYQNVQSWREKLSGWTQYLHPHETFAQIQHFELRSYEQPPLHFSIDLRSAELLKALALDFNLKRAPAFEVRTHSLISLEKFMEESGPFAQIDGRFEVKSFRANFNNLELAWGAEQQILTQLQSELFLPQKITTNLKLDVSLSQKELLSEINAELHGLKKPLDKMKPIRGRISIPQENNRFWSDQNSKFQAEALIPLFFVSKKFRPRVEKACACKLPKELTAQVSGEGNLGNYFSDQDGFLLKGQAELQSLNNDLFTTHALLNGTVHRKDGELDIRPFIDAHLQVHRFQGVSELLKTQGIVIPTPLSVLTGRMQMDMKGPLERNAEIWKVPFSGKVNLGSERQTVNIGSEGRFDLSLDQKFLEAHITVLVQDLVLQLPPMEPVYGIPRVVKDPRFELQPPKPKKKRNEGFKFRYYVQVKTAQPRSIRLLSGLAEPSIPIALNVMIESGQPVKGEIRLADFDIEYLKRRSTVEKFEIELNDPKGAFPLNGRFRFDSNPYKIYIEVQGTLKEPHILLTSDPYLDRSDIISVLLYGRTNDRLVALDSKTVGSFDAALADRAIGLIGIWAFASTPIQSFSYNQLSQQYTAQLKVTDDTTLAVGTNWEQASSLELQKRLSEKWVISASLEPTDENTEEGTTRKLRLQWEDRF